MGVSAFDDARRILEGAEWLAPDAHKLAPLLVDHGKLVRRPTGAWIYAEGDEDTGLLIVVDGAVDLFAHGLGEQRVRVGLVGPGVAGGQSVRFGGGPRLVTAVAATPCEILAVSDTALGRVAEQSPEIWRAVAKLLYGQLRRTLRFGVDMLSLPPAQRVAARLSDIAEVTAKLDALPLSQEALGEMTGLTRKTVNAVLRQLQADGVLMCNYRRIEIRDLNRLRDIARIST
jgi:CRP/FNR family cyclic AMP-dependent transcriptional regulator